MARVDLLLARKSLHDALVSRGLTDDSAKIIEEHYLGNEIIGRASHGLYRIPRVLEHIDQFGPGGPNVSVSIDNGSAIRCDANNLPGVVAMHKTVEIIVDRLPKHPVVAAGVTNYQFGTGVMGRHAFEIARQGFIGIVTANSYALVAPAGGKEPMIGTNPIAIALPSSGKPFVADVSTAATSYGKLAVAMSTGEIVDEGLVIDASGNPSTNPSDADNGAMLALGEHKGFALGMAFELLAGALIGADVGVGRDADNRRDGAFLIALDPSKMGADSFAKDVAQFAESVRSSAIRPGHEEIRTPGERYELLEDPARWTANVEVADEIYERFLRAVG